MTDTVKGPGPDYDNVGVRHDLEHMPLIDPAASAGLLEVFRRRYLLRLLVSREIKARYLGSRFGLLWSYINPLVRFLTFFFVFGMIAGRGAGMQNFAIHLFSGMVIINFFTESYSSGMRSIIANKSLVQKMSIPKELFPVASMLVSLYHTGPQLVILVGACFIAGWHPDMLGFAAAVMGFLIILILATAMALLFSALNVMFRDFGRLVQNITQVVPFSVPMMYPYELVVDRFPNELAHSIYMANPAVEAVLLMQRGFWVTTTDPELDLLSRSFPSDLISRGFVVLGFCLAFLVFAQWTFNKLERRLPEMIG
ncbi:ABC transporter permease [Nocardioides sp. InS609-2]|uniref:ABC transporter permease n=1 Tax=Nocardioides sp. InS609-2 TaxID=2760705 RepID=UPI0020C108BD|nr:ABC transporter permease [Nocardioides sp. InS609-2]